MPVTNGNIPIFNYVGITSSVQGESQVPTRNLNGMIITGNPLVPTGQIVSFQTAAAVGVYFGTSSEEYARAVFYFGWVSKQGTQANLLSFWNWNNDAATNDLIFGGTPISSLTQFNAITSGELELTMGGVTHTLTGINLSAAGSLAAVASDIQTAIQAYSAGGAQWTGATVAYNSTTGTFNLTSGTTGADVINVQAAVSNDLAGPLGWLATASATSPGTILSNGQAAQTISASLNALIAISNNFGSFCFTNALAPSLSTIEAAANWNNSLTPNVQFLFSVQVTPSNASAWEAALNQIGGMEMTLQSPGAQATIEYPEMAPMMVLGATDYTQRNAVQNYEFQQFNLTPSVTNQTAFNTYTGLGINFYGVTQTAGAYIAFYQQGVMYGLATQPQTINVYANEIWFKDALAAQLLNLLLSQTQVSANNAGKSLITNSLQAVVNQAVFNGTISVGTALTTQQIATITAFTGSPTAYQQVQTVGYWLNVVFQTYVVDGVTLYKAVYTLIYKKDDVISQIQGSNILI